MPSVAQATGEDPRPQVNAAAAVTRISQVVAATPSPGRSPAIAPGTAVERALDVELETLSPCGADYCAVFRFTNVQTAPAFVYRVLVVAPEETLNQSLNVDADVVDSTISIDGTRFLQVNRLALTLRPPVVIASPTAVLTIQITNANKLSIFDISLLSFQFDLGAGGILAPRVRALPSLPGA